MELLLNPELLDYSLEAIVQRYFMATDTRHNEGFMALPFDDLSARVENPELWSVEQQIFGGRKLAVREICKVEKLSLKLYVPAKITSQANRAVDSVQNLKRHLASKSTLRRWWLEAKERKGVIGGMREITENVVAKVFAELIKSL